MFTGIIQTIGTIRKLSRRGDYRVLTVASVLSHESLELGESIACDGVCLTVVSSTNTTFTIEASSETARRSILGAYREGSQINLERALQVGGRLGGHFVTGHIDDVGQIDYIKSVGESLELAVRFDTRFDPLVIEKGSIAINGLSLTVNEVASSRLSVNLIPHTVRETTIAKLKAADKVNLEFDMIGKYIARMKEGDSKGKLTTKKLIDSGW